MDANGNGVGGGNGNPVKSARTPACPNCKSWSTPAQRSSRGDSNVVRYRRCRTCGHTFSTVQSVRESGGGGGVVLRPEVLRAETPHSRSQPPTTTPKEEKPGT